MPPEPESYPEGHFVGLWIGIMIACFSGVGVPLAIATGNTGMLGVGPGVGVAVGVAVGSSVEARYRQSGRIRARTEQELQLGRRLTWALGLIAILGLVTLVAVLAALAT